MQANPKEKRLLKNQPIDVTTLFAILIARSLIKLEV